jgi:ssDNA-binding Zn-finger/Zn-ribbon topoisomerase 1
MNHSQVSLKPCPICRTMMLVIGTDNKGKKLTSCGHAFKFKKTRSQKEMDRKYIRTPDGGLELVKEEK